MLLENIVAGREGLLKRVLAVTRKLLWALASRESRYTERNTRMANKRDTHTPRAETEHAKRKPQ